MPVSKRMIAVALAAGLVAGAMVIPAEAAKKKKAKPIPTVLFLEGESTFGEEDQLANGTYLKLVPEAGSGEKSHGIPNYTGGPNPNCAGNSLMPVFVGPTAGTIKGDMTVTFDAMSTPAAKVEVRVWPDMAAQACNESYVEPAGAVVVDLPAGSGTVEAKIEGLDFQASSMMMIQITPVIGGAPAYARAFYGTETSKVEFQCVPAAGAKSCV